MVCGGVFCVLDPSVGEERQDGMRYLQYGLVVLYLVYVLRVRTTMDDGGATVESSPAIFYFVIESYIETRTDYYFKIINSGKILVRFYGTVLYRTVSNLFVV